MMSGCHELNLPPFGFPLRFEIPLIRKRVGSKLLVRFRNRVKLKPDSRVPTLGHVYCVIRDFVISAMPRP